MKLKVLFAGCLLLVACKARQVDTSILKASSTTNVSSNEHTLQSKLDTGSVHQLTTNTKQIISNGKTTIYPTPGKQFTYANGTFTGSADSITQSGTISDTEQSKQDSSARYGITSNAEREKALIAQQKATTDQKNKNVKATPVITSGLLWIPALVVAGFILWEAWQWVKNKI